MRFMVVMWSGDVRECRTDGKQLIHVLNSAWTISPNDPAIRSIRTL